MPLSLNNKPLSQEPENDHRTTETESKEVTDAILFRPTAHSLQPRRSWARPGILFLPFREVNLRMLDVCVC